MRFVRFAQGAKKPTSKAVIASADCFQDRSEKIMNNRNTLRAPVCMKQSQRAGINEHTKIHINVHIDKVENWLLSVKAEMFGDSNHALTLLV